MEQYLKDKIKVTLSGDKDLTYTIKLYDNDFVSRWLKHFKEILKNNLILEKNYCFLGFADSKRDLKYLCNELNSTVKQINDFNQTKQWQNAGLASYHIKNVFCPEDFMHDETLPVGNARDGVTKEQTLGCRLKHEACNILHRYFEDLQGQAWNLSQYYFKADNETKYAIRQLNNLCHEIENWVSAFRKSKYEPEWMRPSQITTFLHAPRSPLQEKDYVLFKKNRYDRELGGVYLHWSQVGKTLYEVWRDNDESVGEGGINHQQLFSGEFDIDWGQTITEKLDFKKEETREFKSWLEKNGFDWEDDKLALGYIKLGQVDLESYFGTTNFLEVHSKMIDCLNISKIELIGSENVTAKYNYSLSDPDWKKLQIGELKKGYESHSLR